MRVRTRYPVLSEALLAGASGQLRNKASIGGNLLQRTRCPYFYDTAADCNKRDPGSGCAAIGGINRIHAILGASDACIATHPSDMAVAMAVARGADRAARRRLAARRVAIGDFHRLPGDTPHIETVLRPGEMITGVRPAPTAAGPANLPQGARPRVLRIRAGVRRRHRRDRAGQRSRRPELRSAAWRTSRGDRSKRRLRWSGVPPRWPPIALPRRLRMEDARGPRPQRLQDRTGQAHALPHAGASRAGGMRMRR